jgi:Protein of unknown function (DUF2911)/Tetratricopeptide repeat
LYRYEPKACFLHAFFISSPGIALISPLKYCHMKKIKLSLFLVILCLAGANAQQLNVPQASPPQYIKQDFGLSSIEISYSRPGMKGRTIFGDLVPYGKVWRTGANGATTINFGEDVSIGDKKVPAGKYGLLTIPGASEWTIIISKQLDVTNPAAYKQDQDLIRITVPAINLDAPVETFSISIGNLTSKSCELDLRWEKKAVRIPIGIDVDAKIMAQINESINHDNRPYYQAAMYYLDNGKNLDQALEWFNKATAAEPDAFYMFYQKARCLSKMGKKQEAISTAQQGIELAKKAGNSDYVALNEKLIASLK